MNNVVIVSAMRSPMGKMNGQFKNISAVELGIQVTKSCIENINLNTDEIDEVIIGNVLSAGLGQNIARQISIGAGIPVKTPAHTINHLCGSGLTSIISGVQKIKAGDADIIIAGGTENMTQAPYLLPQYRFGKKMGNDNIIDSMINDGLEDAFYHYHMGVTAENVADKFNISKDIQDDFSFNSHNKAEYATKNNLFLSEITPIKTSTDDLITSDENIRFNNKLENIKKLKPIFKKNGSVTAANASSISDGASIAIIMSEKKAEELCLTPMAKVKSYSTVGIEPEIMGCGPTNAIKKALAISDMSLDQIDLIELNEAFAAQACAVSKQLNINEDVLNVKGGAIALGHPLGASGARILTTLIHEMNRKNLKYGLASLCVGGGQGVAMIIEK